VSGKKGDVGFADPKDTDIVKRRIDFQKLIDGRYPLHVELEVFNWMQATGKKYDAPLVSWHHPGMDQVMYGYSANTYDSYTDFGRNFTGTLERGFVNAIVKTPIPSVRAWREAERVGLGTYRMLTFSEEVPFRDWDLYREIRGIYEYEGKLLRKEHFHPEYPERTDPKILGMQFSTAGNGYQITLEFSFKNFDYEPGWKKAFRQREGEGINMFIHRFHSEMTRLLLPQVSVDQANAMLQGANRYYPEHVMKALRNGANPNMAVEDGISVLHLACASGDTTTARLLLLYGADANSLDALGLTPLHRACRKGRADSARLLLDAGADPNARGKDNRTPLHHACYRDHPEIARLLLDHGADPGIRDKDNISALEDSCRYGYLECVAALITAGADQNGDAVVPDLTGSSSTPLEIAIKNDDPTREEIIGWYREHYPEMVMEAWCTQGPAQ